MSSPFQDLFDRLAYVGITRASQTLHLVADQEVNS